MILLLLYNIILYFFFLLMSVLNTKREPKKMLPAFPKYELDHAVSSL